MTMTLVESVTVGAGGATSITFSSIPQDADDLFVYISARSSYTGFDNLTLSINGNTSAIYSYQYLQGDTPSVSASSATSQTIAFAGDTTGTNLTANTFSNSSIYFANYKSGLNKPFASDSVSENNASAGWQEIFGGLVATTSAITSITLDTNSGGSFGQYTTAYLYKISTTGATGATVS